jgi:hypothetical protein
LVVYLPPKHTVKQEQLEDFYNTLGRQFIAGGDYNAKHTDWGSRLIIVNFCVTNGIPQDFAVAKSCFDLSSDHSPVLITLTSQALNQEKQPSLSNRHTNWDNFRHFINQRFALNVSLKTEKDIEAAVKFFNDTVQWAGWNATPEHTDRLKT